MLVCKVCHNEMDENTYMEGNVCKICRFIGYKDLKVGSVKSALKELYTKKKVKRVSLIQTKL